jgi:Domain of unknown function (DUF4432)
VTPSPPLPPELLGAPSQLAAAVPSVVADGPAAGCRALDLRVWDGIDLRLLPDRAFDAGAAWYRGTPLAWISAVGEHAPLPAPRDEDWIHAFGGGLVTTCGLRNVGKPSEGHGQHGDISHQRARDVATEREELPDGHAVMRARGTVFEGGALGPFFELRREWTTRTGEGLVELVDRTRNLGAEPEPAPLLYHVNLGAPLWAPGATVEVTSEGVIPRDEAAAPHTGSAARAPEPEPGAAERVFEHQIRPDPDGWARATVRSPAAGLELELRWDAGPLPTMHQWVHPASGIYVLGVEPANCSVLGRAADRAAGRLPMLGPGEERLTRVEIRVRASA